MNAPPTWADVWRETKGWARDTAADALEAFAAKLDELARKQKPVTKEKKA